jgi:hypothetical protein
VCNMRVSLAGDVNALQISICDNVHSVEFEREAEG